MLTLVTGATGLVGNNVVRMLLARGGAVRVLSRATSDPRPLAGLDVEVAQGDVRDPATVAAACRGVERVVHAAGHVHIGWSGLELHRAINVEGARNVARAAREAGARLVHVSSVNALAIGSRETPADEETPIEGTVDCPYVVTKREGERVVLDEVAPGLWGVIVNPVFVLGAWDWKPSSGRMVLDIAKGLGFLAPPGGNDFCDVRHVAAGILSAFERGQPGRRYILGGQSLSYREAWAMFAEVTGGRAPWGICPPRLLRFAGWAGSVLGRVGRHELDVNTASVAMSCFNAHYTSRRAETELGYQTGSAREAAGEAWRWFREHDYA